MLPTLPVAPAAFADSVGLWLALAAVGALTAIVVGLVVHKREARRDSDPALEVRDTKPARDRLSA